MALTKDQLEVALDGLEDILSQYSIDLDNGDYWELSMDLFKFVLELGHNLIYTERQHDDIHRERLHELLRFSYNHVMTVHSNIGLEQLIPVVLYSQDVDTIRNISDIVEGYNIPESHTISIAIRKLANGRDEDLLDEFVKTLKKYEYEIGPDFIVGISSSMERNNLNSYEGIMNSAKLLTNEGVVDAIIKFSTTIPIQLSRNLGFSLSSIGSRVNGQNIDIANLIINAANYVSSVLLPTDMDNFVGIVRGGESGEIKMTWQNPPDSIRWFVLEYHQKYMEELANAEIDLIKRIEPYASGLTVQDREHRYQTIRQKYLQQPIPDIAKKYVEIEVTNQGVYVNGSLYGGKKEHSDKKISFDPAAELLQRISEYIDPNVNFQVPTRHHPEDGNTYSKFIEEIRHKLRTVDGTHLAYTTLAHPDKSKGTHYIVADDEGGNNLLFAISVRGRRLRPNEDSEHYYGVQKYAVLQRVNGAFKPISDQELLDQISRNSPINAKTVIMGLN